MTAKPAEPLKMTPGWRPEIPSLALQGTRVETGEPSISLPYGHTVRWATPSRTLTKDEVEFWQLGQFCSDLYTATGQEPAARGAEKNEAPDFIVHDEEGAPLGVELAAFTPGARRAHEARVERFRAQMATMAEGYAHLTGCHISLSMDDPDIVGRLNAKDRRNILDKLRNVDRPAPLGPYGPTSTTTLCVGEGWQLHGYELWRLTEQPQRLIDQLPIFDVVFGLEQTLDEVASEVERIIASHKYPGIDWLVIPIVGPDTNGFGYWEDEALIDLVLDNVAFPSELTAMPETRVRLHFWTTGAIREVIPADIEISRPRHAHQRRMTILGHHQGDLYSAPISQPAVQWLNRIEN